MSIFGSKSSEKHGEGFRSQLGGEARPLAGSSIAQHLVGTKRDGNVRHIPLDRIAAKKQVREEFDDVSLGELANSLREHGQQQACLVYWDEDEQKFIIIAGERRFRAAKIAELRTLKCDVLKEKPTESEIHELQLVENVQRKDLSPIEEARAYQKFKDDFGYTQEEIAKKTGKTQGTISKRLQLLKLPDEIQAGLLRTNSSKHVAETFLRMQSLDDQLQALQALEDGELTVAEIKQAVTPKSTTRSSGKPSSKQQRAKKSRGIDLKATGKKRHTNTDFALATLDWCEDLATNKRAAVDTEQVIGRLREVLGALENGALQKAA